MLTDRHHDRLGSACRTVMTGAIAAIEILSATPNW
jgi:hypothetical protein